MSVLTLTSKEYKETFPPLLKEYATYMTVIKGNSEKTVCEYLLDLRTFFRYLCAGSSVQEMSADDFSGISIRGITLDDAKAVTPQTVIEFLMFVGMDRKNSNTTRMRKISALRSFYHYLFAKKHYIDRNPMEEIESPKKSHTLPKYLTMEEALLLLRTVEADKESKTRIRDYAIITLFLNTGMRLSELVGLDLTSFTPDLSSVTVVGKGNKERVVYLNDAARGAVAEYLRERLDPKFISTSIKAFFLSGRDKRISNKTVQWIVYKYLRMAGLGSRGLSVHKLRHTAATLMYQSGNVDIRVLKDILGHEQLNTTQIYTHVVSGNMERAMYSNPLSEITPKNTARSVKSPRGDDSGTTHGGKSNDNR